MDHQINFEVVSDFQNVFVKPEIQVRRLKKRLLINNNGISAKKNKTYFREHNARTFHALFENMKRSYLFNKLYNITIDLSRKEKSINFETIDLCRI